MLQYINDGGEMPAGHVADDGNEELSLQLSEVMSIGCLLSSIVSLAIILNLSPRL